MNVIFYMMLYVVNLLVNLREDLEVNDPQHCSMLNDKVQQINIEGKFTSDRTASCHQIYLFTTITRIQLFEMVEW